MAGSLGYHGAAVLAARGAQRAQPGLITLFTQEISLSRRRAAIAGGDGQYLEAGTEIAGLDDAILIGPGLAAPDMADEMKTFTRHLWRDSKLPVVVDASALDWLLPPRAFPKNALRVITPHPGEAARLLSTTAQQVQANRSHALRNISRRFGNCWVVLKGHQTLIGRSTGEIFVNPSGNPHLAQGGSGDVLAGFIAGLLAQPALQADAGKTIRYAVWQHGTRQTRCKPRGRIGSWKIW